MLQKLYLRKYLVFYLNLKMIIHLNTSDLMKEEDICYWYVCSRLIKVIIVYVHKKFKQYFTGNVFPLNCVPAWACENVASDGLGGGFRRVLRFPPLLTTQLASHKLATISINVTKNKIPNPNPLNCGI